MLKSHTHGSLKYFGLTELHMLHYIMLKVAQQLCELIYLWQAWRGQHFFHTFEKSLSGRKWTSQKCCIICTWVGIVCVFCVHVCICVGLCAKTCVRLLAVLWGIAWLGSSFRKPNTGTGSWELGTSSGWLMTTGGLVSVAIWGDNNQASKKDIIRRQWVLMCTGYLEIENPGVENFFFYLSTL